MAFFSDSLWGVISPPGLGPTNSASWVALGLQQNLDKESHLQSLTYVGLARISSVDGYNPVAQQSIFVLNEEFYHQFSRFSQYSLALSYRRQNEYEDGAPFLAADPAIKQEFRGYGRYTFALPLGAFKWSLTGRQEFRRFLAPDFGNLEELYQFRSRLKSQIVWKVDSPGVHQLTLAAELLFSVSRLEGGTWSSFNYRESRFGFYYSLFPKNAGVAYSFGYMNDLLGEGRDKIDAHYFTFDVVFLNPFGKL